MRPAYLLAPLSALLLATALATPAAALKLPDHAGAKVGPVAGCIHLRNPGVEPYECSAGDLCVLLGICVVDPILRTLPNPYYLLPEPTYDLP